MLVRWKNKNYEKKIKGEDIKHLEHGSEHAGMFWFQEFYQGRSALGVILRDYMNRSCPMDLTDFENLLKARSGIEHDDTGLYFCGKVRIHRHAGYTRIVPVL